MTLEQLLQKGIIQLEEANISEAKLDAMYLLEHVCQITRMDYLLDAKKPVSAEQEEEYDAFISKRAQHIPLQQLLGEQEFMGYSFFVNENVLIPRQDTEILVEEVAKLGSGKRILDVCTGSGCILLSLEKLCEPVVAVGVDISEQALEVANKNKERLASKAKFLHSDLLEKVEGTYDIIVSNPPYIASAVIPTLMEEVREHEPMLALDGGETGLDFYEKIVEQSVSYLNEGGYLCFEIGYDQGKAVSGMMQEKGFIDCKVIKDLAGLDRVVIGQWSEEHG